MGRPKGGHNFCWKAHPEVDARLLEICRGRLSQDVADQLNREFGTAFTGKQIISHLRNHGHSLELGTSKKGVRYRWTPEVEDYVRTHADRPYAEILDGLEKELGFRANESQLGHFKDRHDIPSCHDGRYAPGSYPGNTAPVGAETMRQGHVYMKVSDAERGKAAISKNWRPKTHAVWEQNFGPVPEGMAVIQLDGDPMNFDPANLRLISRTELGMLIRMGLNEMEPEVRPTGELVARLKAEIYTRRRNSNGNADDDGRTQCSPVRDDRTGE